MSNPDLAGVHFTGSTAVFQGLWQNIGRALPMLKSYPRIVGETGGKDFIFAHPSANVEALSAATIRGAFEYQGQKCSAASRMYVPQSLWPQLIVFKQTSRGVGRIPTRLYCDNQRSPFTNLLEVSKIDR